MRIHGIQLNKLNDGLQTLERAHKVGAVRPRAAIVNVQRISILLRREFGVVISCDPVAEFGGLTTELAIAVRVFVRVLGVLDGVLGVLESRSVKGWQP